MSTLNLISQPLGAPPSVGTQGSLLFEEETFLSGTIERITYFNPQNGQCVLDVKAPKTKSHFLVTGFLSSAHPGLTVDASLILNNEQKRKLKASEPITDVLKAASLVVRAPQSSRDLKKFLKSGALPAVGKHLSKIIGEAFDNNFFTILDENPERLRKISGIGAKRFKQIMASWAEYKFINQFEQYLFTANLPLSWARILWVHHAFDARHFLQTNPYETVKRYDFSFQIVDAFALKQGFRENDMTRVRCALFDVLKTHYKQGHCAYPEDKTISETAIELMLDTSLVDDALELELLEENVVIDTIDGINCIYIKDVWETERRVAKLFADFKNKPPPWGEFHLQKVLMWAQDLLEINLAPLQVKAIETALSSKLTVITGGPGTGKTTLIRSLITILKTQHCPFVMCSPTGRGAQRLEETTGAPGLTIHRLLKYNSATGGFVFNKDNRLNVDLVLVDEVSMVDLQLMSHLLEALPPHCALILVGDVDQIPPVGAGHILQSLIESNQFTTVKLTEIFRQSKDSAIKINAQKINQGEMPTESTLEGEFHYIKANGRERIQKTLVSLLTKTIPQRYGIVDPQQVQVLVPMNKGPLGTIQLNEELQQYFTDFTGHEKSISGFEHYFKTGDKVMVTKNDYRKDVFNGDIGFIHNINHFEQFVEVQFDERRVFFNFDELDRLTLAYAISIHKSQGSEYRAVIVVIAEEHLPLVRRQLIYTAITRGKEHVFLVAEPLALKAALTLDENNRRWQKLSELLVMDAPAF